MEVFVFRITTDYCIHTEAENYLLAYQFQKKNKTDNFLQHVRLDTAKSVCQLMKQWLRNGYHFTKFTKSLIKTSIYLRKYRINVGNTFSKKYPKAFTKYHIERVKASYAIKNSRFYKTNKCLSFHSTSLSIQRSVKRLHYVMLHTYLMVPYEDHLSTENFNLKDQASIVREFFSQGLK